MAEYNFAVIEKKWQDIWQEKGAFSALEDHSKPKYYVLVAYSANSRQLDCRN